MREVQFVRCPAQGNIYSAARIGNVTIFGSGNYGKIMAHLNQAALEELPLSSIPIGSDIIALDACQHPYCIIGLTFVQKSQVGIDEVKTAYLNFYTTWEDSSDEHLNQRHFEAIGQKCVQFKLGFIPYHLYHCQVQNSPGIYRNVFLLSGSDCRIYAYEPNEEGRTFLNVPVETYFPELEGTFPSVVTRIQVELVQSLKKRITVCGCENGQLKSFIVSDFESLDSFSIQFSKKLSDDIDKLEERKPDDPSQRPSELAEIEESCADSLITSMNEEMDFGNAVQKITNHFDGMITDIVIYTDGSNINAVVSSANSPVYLFIDTVDKLFRQGSCLKFSSRWDSVEAICVADIDFDGHAEIIIGTFGCTLLVYKFMEEQIGQWVIVAHRKFPSVIYSIEFFDYHLYVVTASGLHIIEYSTDAYFHKRGLDPNPALMIQYVEDIKKIVDEDE